MGRDDAGSKSGRIWLVILAVLLPVIMLSAAAYLLLFGYNRFSLEPVSYTHLRAHET